MPRKRKVSKEPVLDRSELLAELTKSIGDFQLWSDVKAPKVLQTSITSFNRVSKIGGLSAGMLSVVHGPSQGGKTVFVSEVLKSAVTTGGLGLFVDAECRGVDLKWFSAICGDLREILYYKPVNFEQCIKRVQEFRDKFRKFKEEGKLNENAILGIGIDSLNRLAPKDELKLLQKDAKVKDRKYPIRPLMISSWLDVLVPTLEADEVIVCVLRESKRLDAMPGQKQYRVKGGVAPGYDSGQVYRITARHQVKIRKPEGVPDVVIGEKHEVEICKNSMGSKDGEAAWFYTSVGAEEGEPLGLDGSREVRDEIIARGVAVHRDRKEGKGYYVGDVRVAADKPKLLGWLLEEVDGRPRYLEIAQTLNAEVVGAR